MAFARAASRAASSGPSFSAVLYTRILAGAAIVMTVMRKLGAVELTISDRGLRHGLFYDRYVRGGKTTC